MTKFKDFGSGANLDELEAVSFKLYNEEFNCLKQVPGKLLLDIAKDAGSEDVAKNAEMLDKFFGYVLEEESLVRFNALTADTKRVVTVDTLAEIVGWLMEQYANRPEAQPEV